MEDNSQTLTNKPKPSILEIKPVEEVKVEQKPVEEDIQVPEIKEDESIFIQQKKTTTTANYTKKESFK